MRIQKWSVGIFFLLAFVGNTSLWAAFHENEKDEHEDIQKREEWFNRPRLQGLNGRNPAELLLKARRQAKSMAKSFSSLIHALSGPMGAGPSAGNWTALGPQPVTNGSISWSGRGSAIAIDLVKDPTGNTVYYGAASGGIWKSTNALGPSPQFTPISDQTESLMVGAIALDSSMGQSIVYVGTGEANGGINATYYGVGLLKSTDGGNSWSAPVTAATGPGGTVPFFGLAFSRIIVDPVNPLVLVAATTPGGFSAGNLKVGSLQPLNISPGIFRSTDGGNSWTQSASLAGDEVDDLVYDPTRQTYFAAVSGMGFYKSTDQGLTWTFASWPFLNPGGFNPAPFFKRTSLAARGGILYCLVSLGGGLSTNISTVDTGIYQSTDGANSWTAIAHPPGTSDVLGGQLNYDQVIAAPPGSAALVVGGVILFRADTVAGTATTWTDITPPHPDQHALFPIGSSQWLVACDGGLFSTGDSGADWSGLNSSLNTIQFYSVSPDSNLAEQFVGGSQDNASEITSGGSLVWNVAFGGDGFYTLADPQNAGVYYGESTFGDIERYNSNSGSDTTVLNPIITGVPPIELVPQAPGTIVAGGSRVLAGPGNPPSPGAGWVSIGGPFPDGSDVGFLCPAPGSLNTIYLTEGDFIQKTVNAFSASTPLWTQINPAGLSLPLGHIAVNPTNSNTVYVAVEGFYDGQKIYKSADGGGTWTNISGNLPNNPVNWIAIDPQNTGSLYLATDVGVFLATDGGVSGENWQVVGAGLPDAPILQVKISGLTRQLVAATFGRGAWTFNIGGTLAPTFTPTPTPTSTATFTPTSTATFTSTPTLSCVPSGAVWVPATTSAGFSPRDDFGSVVHNGQMWVIGGRTGIGIAAADNRDVWSSSDGVSWTSVNPAAFLPAREEFTALAFDAGNGLGEQMWVIGGLNAFGTPPNQILNDVLYSADGVNWNTATSNANFPARLGPACVVFAGRMWVMGGGGFDDVWSSANGVTWVQNAAHVPGFLQIVSNAAVLNNKIWSVSQSGLSPAPNHLWSSPDGSNWTPVTVTSSFPERDNFALLSYAGRLWVIGGTLGTQRFNDVWSSPDGAVWSQAVSMAPFAPRGLYQGGLVFGGQMWALGGLGNDNVSVPFNDTWHTVCGTGPGGIPPGVPAGRSFNDILSLQVPGGGAQSAAVTVTLPAFTTLVSSSVTPSTAVGSQLIFNLGTLPPGTTQIILNLAVSPSAPGGASLVPLVLAGAAGGSISSQVSPPFFAVLGPTATATPILTPTETPACGITSPNLDLKVSVDKDRDDQDSYSLYVKNNDPSISVAVSDLLVKIWVLDSEVKCWNLDSLSGGKILDADKDHFTRVGNQFTLSSLTAELPCVALEAGKENWELDISDQSGQVIPPHGGSWISGTFLIHRCHSKPDFDRFSGLGDGGFYRDDPQVALFYKNQFVAEGGGLDPNTGRIPCTTPCPTLAPTPQGWEVSALNAGQEAVPRVTPTATLPAPTASPTDTPTPTPGSLPLVLAAPNISRNGTPIQFQVTLGQPAQIELSLFSLVGERLYQASLEGGAGLNNLLWRLQNQSGGLVASGLYFYRVQAGSGSGTATRTGKVAVLR